MLMTMLATLAIQSTPPPATVETPPASVRPGAGIIVLPQDTPVELMATVEVTTASATPGTVFKLRVNRAIEIDGRVVVPVGTPAFGEVTSAKASGGLGKSGRMTAELRRIQLGDTEIPIDGDLSAMGTGSGSAGAAILLTGVVGLFHRGNNAKIKAGEIVAGFVARDVEIAVAPQSGAAAARPPAMR